MAPVRGTLLPMCGRYSLAAPGDVIAELFELGDLPADLVPRWNIAPTQQSLVVRVGEDGGKQEGALLRWGLVPFWAKDVKIGNRMINARSETASVKPSFRDAMKRRRCLVLADGFYEWQRTADGKVPTRIQQRDAVPFGFAGLWERWGRGDELLETFTILTKAANAQLRDIHDRMPCVLRTADHGLWLDPDVTDAARVVPLLSPGHDPELETFTVSTRVNTPRNDDAECAAPF